MLLLIPHHFGTVLCPSLYEMFPCYLLKRSYLYHSIVFLCFFALLTEEGFLISPAILGTLNSNEYIFPFLVCLSLLFFSQLFVRPPQTTILPFLYFFFLGMVLITASCTMSQTSAHSSLDTLSNLIPLTLFVTFTV